MIVRLTTLRYGSKNILKILILAGLRKTADGKVLWNKINPVWTALAPTGYRQCCNNSCQSHRVSIHNSHNFTLTVNWLMCFTFSCWLSAILVEIDILVKKRVINNLKFGAGTDQNWCRFVVLFSAGKYQFGAAMKVQERRNKVLIRILAVSLRYCPYVMEVKIS